MILPLSDAPNPPRTPYVTYALIAINCLVYALFNLPLETQPVNPADPRLVEYLRALQQSLPPNVPIQAVIQQISAFDLFVFEHGYRPGAPQITDLFASMFLHSGFMHLFGNMLFLWIYGDNVEYQLGRLRYLFWYLVTGAIATLSFALLSPGSLIPMVGASGAISGVLGFYFVWFPRNVVRMFVFLFPFFMNTVTIPARIVLGIYLFADNLLPLLLSAGQRGGGVAYGAHIGGFIAGMAVAWVLNRREATTAPEAYRQAPVAEPPAADAISGAMREGNMLGAARAYFALPPDRARRVLEPGDSIRLANWLAENGQGDAALAVYRRHLRDYPSGPGAAEAHVGAGLVQLRLLGQPAPAYQHFLDALDLDPGPETEALARQGLQQVAQMQKFPMRGFSGGR
jgi:membrane associated rhomboid family serine protease